MIETIFNALRGLGNEFALFLVSIIPFIELRGSIPFGIGVLKMAWYEVLPICVLANCVPIPFVMLLTRPIFDRLKKTKLFAGPVERLEARMMKKSEKVTKYKIIGLFLFVALPIPGTGAYSGALIAALLGMRYKKAIPSIALGLVVAGIIMTVVSLLGVHGYKLLT